MQIVIPMTGRGSRFVRAGYTDIKPLIQVDGRPIIAHVIDLFPGEEDFTFVCARDHLESTPLRVELKALKPRGKILSIEPHKLGPVHSVLEAQQHLRDDEPVIVSYCDYSLYWSYGEFLRFVEKTRCDGCIPTYRGFHPHSLGPNHYAYSRAEGDRMREIREKQCFTDDRMNEPASAGMYYFRTGALMKRYFRDAVDKKLVTNGEFYASLPYNLMVRDGLDVRLYDVEHFLQWGTPEDLREYQTWSRYFSRSPEESPARRSYFEGTLLVPMAGAGERFRREGYDRPKPLVTVDGVAMVERVLASLPRYDRRVAVCRSDVPGSAEIRTTLRGPKHGVQVVELPALTDGAVRTCLAAEDRVNPEAPLLVAACDSALFHDEARFSSLTAAGGPDYVIWTFRNHPHANRHPAQYAWVEADTRGGVVSVACKRAISDSPWKDPGVTGTFWFRRAEDFFRTAKEVVASGEKAGGEFHVDLVAARLAREKVRGTVFDVEFFVCFGTPEDVRTYEYWASYFRKIASRISPVSSVSAARRAR